MAALSADGAKTDAKAQAYETLKVRLRQRMDDRGISDRALSRMLGDNESYIGQVLSGKNGIPGAARLRQIAELLKTTTDWLVGKVDSPTQFESEVSFAELPRGWNHGDDAHGIRLVASAFCDDLIVPSESGGELHIERIQIEVDHIVRMIERPAALWNAHEAYAIYFQGSSMERRFYQGDIGVVDPRRPPGRGEIGLFQLSDGSNAGVVTAIAKELVRATSGYVELLQYNPESTFRVPRSQVVAMHRIYRPDELLRI